MNEAEAYAEKLLKEHSLVVQRIPRADSPTADLLVNDDAGSYLVEVTRKAPSAFLKRLRDEARVTGVADGDRRLRASNLLDGIVRSKARQLSNTAVLAQHRVLWLTAFHSDWEHLGRELERTLYGTTRLVSVTSSRSAPTVRKCYYYHHFVYYRVSDLAGVVFATPRGARLYVNPLGHTASEFQHSLLYRAFGHACVDPTQLKDPDEVLFVAFGIDRSSDRARWEHLRQRYGRMTSVMQEHCWHGYASLDGLTDADEQAT